MVQQQPVVVFDMGSNKTRVGFAGEEAPRVISSTVVGVPRQRGLVGSLMQHYSDDYAGDAACAQEGMLTLSYPVRNRRITSMPEVEHFLQDVFYSRLPLVPSNTMMLWVESVRTSREDRERLCEMMFESFGLPQLGLVAASATTVFSTGRTTGLVVDSGEGCTNFNAVWEGYNLQYATHTSDVAGRVLTDRLLAFLRAKGYPLSTPNDRRIVEDVKHTLCYVAADVQEEVKKMHKKLQKEYYGLPDEQRIYVEESQFMVPELLFNPSAEGDIGCCGRNNAEVNVDASGVGAGGWTDAIAKVVESAPHFTRPHLLKSIVLGGGNTMFPGIEQRLRREVSALPASAECEANCVAFRDRDLAAWIGGSVVASMPTFPHMCLSRKDYLEKGATVVHERI
ncbi:actin-like protein, putative [Trypanosoma equiperdum]|uniref:Actin-like protein, putative n=1 Tax=Trypanosoma equiperdum TaxID=5694 RepID=A0A1G4IJN3_TRYEQ|nr:actin-like protein, putative [Trypanosoma equiperdum]